MRLLALWSFANPSLLWWVLAAAVPILIHLWSRRRYRETPWAATQFLLAALRKNQRRIRIEQLLLLAIRTLLLLLLALALAEPLLSGTPISRALRRRPPTHALLVLDASYSMDYQQGGKTRFARAQQLAVQAVQKSQPGDTFTVLMMADPPRAIVAEPSADRGSVAEEIQNLEVSHGGADLSATLAQVLRLVQEAAARATGPATGQVHIFTDLGGTTWSEESVNDARRLLEALDSRASLRLIDVGESNAANAAVTRLAADSRTIVVGQPINLTVEVEKFGGERQSRQQIELLADGFSVASQPVDLVADGRLAISFPYRFESPGEHIVQARIGEDSLELDNRRGLSIPVREAIRVLCVQGRLHAADYVALALAPEREQPSVIQPEVVSEQALLERELQDYDCIFLCNVARIGPDEARALREYVRQGGGLVITLGDLVQVDSYNEQLGGNAEQALLPCRLGAVNEDGLHHFDPMNYEHELVAPFRGHERAGLLTVPVWRYIRGEDVDDKVRVAMRFDNGDPALVEMPLGKGRVLLFTSAVSPESSERSAEARLPWTAMASWPSFPPLVHEMLNLASVGRWQRRNLTVGEMILSQLPEGVDGEDNRMILPDDHESRLAVDFAERTWRFADTEQSGTYRARFGEQDYELFAVNLDTRESDLSRVEPESLGDYFNHDTVGESGVTPEDLQAPLFRFFLAGVVALLVADTWLAWRFGRDQR